MSGYGTATRTVVATARTGSSFTRGNRGHLSLGRTAGLSHAEAYRIYGTPPVNPAGKVPHVPAFERKERPGPQWGNLCPGCGTTRSRAGFCTCNEDGPRRLSVAA